MLNIWIFVCRYALVKVGAGCIVYAKNCSNNNSRKKPIRNELRWRVLIYFTFAISNQRRNNNLICVRSLCASLDFVFVFIFGNVYFLFYFVPLFWCGSWFTVFSTTCITHRTHYIGHTINFECKQNLRAQIVELKLSILNTAKPPTSFPSPASSSSSAARSAIAATSHHITSLLLPQIKYAI